MTTLILWEANESLMPTDQEERVALIMSMLEGVKTDLASGNLKMWGISSGGGNGYSISEQNAKEIFALIMKYTPYITFKVKPMLSVDEMIDVMKTLQQ